MSMKSFFETVKTFLELPDSDRNRILELFETLPARLDTAMEREEKCRTCVHSGKRGDEHPCIHCGCDYFEVKK